GAARQRSAVSHRPVGSARPGGAVAIPGLAALRAPDDLPRPQPDDAHQRAPHHRHRALAWPDGTGSAGVHRGCPGDGLYRLRVRDGNPQSDRAAGRALRQTLRPPAPQLHPGTMIGRVKHSADSAAPPASDPAADSGMTRAADWSIARAAAHAPGAPLVTIIGDGQLARM